MKPSSPPPFLFQYTGEMRGGSAEFNFLQLLMPETLDGSGNPINLVDPLGLQECEPEPGDDSCVEVRGTPMGPGSGGSGVAVAGFGSVNLRQPITEGGGPDVVVIGTRVLPPIILASSPSAPPPAVRSERDRCIAGLDFVAHLTMTGISAIEALHIAAAVARFSPPAAFRVFMLSFGGLYLAHEVAYQASRPFLIGFACGDE